MKQLFFHSVKRPSSELHSDNHQIYEFLYCYLRPKVVCCHPYIPKPGVCRQEKKQEMGTYWRLEIDATVYRSQCRIDQSGRLLLLRQEFYRPERMPYDKSNCDSFPFQR